MISEVVTWLGPWADDEHPDRPRPEDHIDENCDEWERHSVADYLQQGFYVGAPLDGNGVCSLCGLRMYRGYIYTDGVFIWRAGLAHYVEEHSVRMPQRFIDRMYEMIGEMESIGTENKEWWDNDPYASDNISESHQDHAK